jgi:hypothetical protein
LAEFRCCGWEGTALWAHEIALAANRSMQPANFLCNIVLLTFHSPGQNQQLSYRENPQVNKQERV